MAQKYDYRLTTDGGYALALYMKNCTYRQYLKELEFYSEFRECWEDAQNETDLAYWNRECEESASVFQQLEREYHYWCARLESYGDLPF